MINFLYRLKWSLFPRMFTKLNGWRFEKIGNHCVVRKPLKISYKSICLGNNVNIWPNCRIEAVIKDEKNLPKIKLGNNVSIQQNLHLTCGESIIIGDNTAIASNVTITDIIHPYENIDIPIEKQAIYSRSVIIGEDSKIYNNTVVLPGVTIGKHVTIGANSVVTKDIPDYCVAVGSPAKVIKKYNFKKNIWERV